MAFWSVSVMAREEIDGIAYRVDHLRCAIYIHVHIYIYIQGALEADLNALEVLVGFANNPFS